MERRAKTEWQRQTRREGGREEGDQFIRGSDGHSGGLFFFKLGPCGPRWRNVEGKRDKVKENSRWKHGTFTRGRMWGAGEQDEMLHSK